LRIGLRGIEKENMSIIAPFDSSTVDGISVDAITTLMGESGTWEQILKAFPAPFNFRSHATHYEIL
jgi:hypothetical protein